MKKTDNNLKFLEKGENMSEEISSTEKQVMHNLIGAEGGSRIAEVVVFSDQAYVTRRAKVSVEAGKNQLLLELKAFSVESDSVQANVFGRGEILNVQYKELPVRDAPQKDVKELKEKLRQLERARKKISDKREVCSKQEKFLDSVIGFAETQVPEDVKTEFPEAAELGKMVHFLDNNYNSVFEKAEKLEHEILEYDKEIKVIKRKLKIINAPEDKKTKAIEILFETEEDQEIGIEASYLVNNASWSPVYKADVPLDLNSVTMTMFADIRQNTGETWENIRLSVSNVVPLTGAELPSQDSWYLDLPVPPAQVFAGSIPAAAPMRKKSAKEEPEEEMDMMMSCLSEAEPAAEFSQAREKALPHAFEYDLPQKITVKSGDDETLLPVFTKDLKGDYFGYAVPKKEPVVFLVCRATSDQTFLKGALNVYFGGRFVGSGIIEEKKPGEELLLNLGAERNIRIKSEKIHDRVKETYFKMVDRNTVPREISYRTVIENLKDKPVRIWLFDSIPVSKTDRIQVKISGIEPEPSEKDYQMREGVLFWDLKVGPQRSQEVRLDFIVSHPKNRKPYGI